MKEKERKLIERERQLDLIRTAKQIQYDLAHPKKSIEFLVAYHKTTRNAFFEEIIESLLGEYNNLLIKLERYGENSNYWSRNENVKEYESFNPESKRPSPAWLRTKVKRYEHETINQNSTR